MTIKVAFIRMKLSATAAVLEMLWQRRLVALHYTDNESTDPNDYGPAGAQALQRLHDYAAESRLIGADFRELYRDRMLVGRLDSNFGVRSVTFEKVVDGQQCFYKVAKLVDAVEIPYARFPVLLATQPRQTALTGWPSASLALNAAFKGVPLPRDVRSLSPEMLEVVCYEWLMLKGKIKHLVMPIGRGMVDVDIFGINSENQRVLAQVTHASSKKVNRKKASRLSQHASGADVLFYFGPDRCSIGEDRLQFVPIEEVFCDLDRDPSTSSMISMMLGQRDVSECRTQA